VFRHSHSFRHPRLPIGMKQCAEVPVKYGRRRVPWPVGPA
jgi:hypothetical protein